GPQRHCPRVNAPAVLLWLDADVGDGWVEAYGGRPELAKQVKTLYPYFFSPAKDREIAQGLLASERAS
ncbi:MAG: long-chain N-acyl amino acid synthase, partial [Myxococcota bacterium]|nr:long-chain N-acyl amino acid synthase [Myxococcota bacterium]